MGKNKDYMRNGLWPTSPGQDPLITKLADIFLECSEETAYGCSFCPMFKKCYRLWILISNKGPNPMKQWQFDHYKAKFNKIKDNKQNGWMTVDEVSAILNVSIWTTLRYLRNGELQGFKVNGNGSRHHWRVRRVDLEDYIATTEA